jgi:NhaP-type Na+/H+ or K+/H+ antiporter
MSQNLLLGLASIIFLGIVAEWLAWRIRLPSILLLLLFGFIAGPITGLLDPDIMFGDLLLPIVSLAVAIVLFEGGLHLRIEELRHTRSTIRNLITIGALVSFTIGSLAAYYILHMTLEISLLIGAILIVTGPTVIVPLLRHLRPSGQVGSILKWEGIVIDPIGAILAVLVFQVIIAEGFCEGIGIALINLL